MRQVLILGASLFGGIALHLGAVFVELCIVVGLVEHFLNKARRVEQSDSAAQLAARMLLERIQFALWLWKGGRLPFTPETMQGLLENLKDSNDPAEGTIYA